MKRISPSRRLELIWQLFETEGITHYNAAPTVQLSLVNYRHAHRLAHAITMTIAGAPPSPTLLERMKELNFRPIHVYGLTETYGPYVICEWHRGGTSLR